MHAEPSTPSEPRGPARLNALPILVVDDEDAVRDVLVRWLASSGYAALPARSADEALTRLDTSPAAVVLCDIRMPGHDGLWLAARIRQRHPETAVIMSSGVHDIEAATESARQGVVDYLVKPFGRERLREAVSRALDWHASAWDARQWRETLQREMDGLESGLRDRLHERRITTDAELDTWLQALPPASQEIVGHMRRVADLSDAIAGVMAYPGLDVTVLRRAALLHDLGKLALPDAVLRKPAPLTAGEHSLVRSLPHLTADLLSGVPFLAPAAPIVRDVAERMDGQGYPRGLRAEAVAVEARIVAVADAYDAMTHARVHRDAISSSEALLELERCAGTQFDVAVVAAFEKVSRDISRVD